MQITYVTRSSITWLPKFIRFFHIHRHYGCVWIEVVSVSLQTKSVPGRFWKRQYIIQFLNHTFITKKKKKIKKCNKKKRQSVISCIGIQESCSMGSELKYKIAQSPLCCHTRNTENASHRTPSTNCHSQGACKLACSYPGRATWNNIHRGSTPWRQKQVSCITPAGKLYLLIYSSCPYKIRSFSHI